MAEEQQKEYLRRHDELMQNIPPERIMDAEPVPQKSNKRICEPESVEEPRSSSYRRERESSKLRPLSSF